MDFKAFFLVIFCICSIVVNAQNENLKEVEENLFWQPNVKINYSHFQSESDTDCKKYNEKYGLKMSANIQLNGIVDIPTSHLSKKMKKRTGFDKSYLAPVFYINCSCILSEDSLELKVSQLLFDVAEMCARAARKELFETQSEMNINNVNTMFFTTVKNNWVEKMRGTWGSIFQDVLIQKKDGAYAEWRKLVDELLDVNESFATQPNEIKRLILGKPIEPDYVEAEQIMGDFKNKDEK